MQNKKAKLYLDNKITIVDVTDVEISFNREVTTQFYGGMDVINQPPEIVINRIISNFYGDSSEMDEMYEPVARKILNLKLDENKKLLQKYNITKSDGTLTNEGKEALLVVLLEENLPKLIEALKQIEAETKEKK